MPEILWPSLLVFEFTKPAYAGKTREYFTFQGFGSPNVRQNANSVLKKGKSNIPHSMFTSSWHQQVIS